MAYVGILGAMVLLVGLFDWFISEKRNRKSFVIRDQIDNLNLKKLEKELALIDGVKSTRKVDVLLKELHDWMVNKEIIIRKVSSGEKLTYDEWLYYLKEIMAHPEELAREIASTNVTKQVKGS